MSQKKKREKNLARERQLARKKQERSSISRSQMIWIGISIVIAIAMVAGTFLSTAF